MCTTISSVWARSHRKQGHRSRSNEVFTELSLQFSQRTGSDASLGFARFAHRFLFERRGTEEEGEGSVPVKRWVQSSSHRCCFPFWESQSFECSHSSVWHDVGIFLYHTVFVSLQDGGIISLGWKLMNKAWQRWSRGKNVSLDICLNYFRTVSFTSDGMKLIKDTNWNICHISWVWQEKHLFLFHVPLCSCYVCTSSRISEDFIHSFLVRIPLLHNI